MGIPFTQQGTTVWNYGLEQPGIEPLSLSETAHMASGMNLGYLDILSPEQITEVISFGLGIRVASTTFLDVDGKGTLPFVAGPNNSKHHPMFARNTRKLITAAANSGICERVTVFFGDERAFPGDPNNPHKIELGAGIANCVKAFQEVIKVAENEGITLVLEMLNDKNRGHAMKGHPYYQGNKLNQCLEVIHYVDSPNMKLLFDIYHVGLMETEKTPAQWIRELGTDIIGLVHTAAQSERQETHLDEIVDQQECMSALNDIGYDGPVIHECLRTRSNQAAALRASAEHCAGTRVRQTA